MMQRVREKGIPWPAPSFFRSRPLMCGALSFMIGIALSRALGYADWLWAVGPVLVGIAVLVRRFRRVAGAVLCLGLLAFGVARGGNALQAPELPPMGKWAVEGVIDSDVTRKGQAAMFTIRDVKVQTQEDGEWRAISGAMYCYCPTASAKLAYGQRISVSGSAYLPSDARNPGGFDQRTWLAQKGAHVRLYASSSPKVLSSANWSLYGMALSINHALAERMDALFGPASPVVRAMLLGDQTEIAEDWSDWMRDSGIAHILSVSGLHVALWYGMLAWLLRPLPVSPGVRWILLAVLLAVYALITGLRPSVLRAVIMLLAIQGAHVAGRKSDVLTNLSLAAFIILVFRPLDLFGASFQMSFCAVLGIVLLRPVLQKAIPIRWTWLGEPLYITISAQLGILPALSYWMGSASLLGSLANLLAVPLAGMLVPVSALATALSAIWGPLGWFFVQAAKGMVAVLLLIAQLAAGLPLANAPVGAFAWWTAAAYFAAMLLCCTAVIWRWRARFAAMAALALVAVCIGFFSGSFWVRYVQLDVGQALSGVLHVGSKAYVYDCGDENSDLTEYLLFTGSTVEGLFLSHPHKDHVGGATELLDAGIDVRTLYVPANATAFGGDPGYEERIAKAQAQGAEIVEVSAGDVLNLNGVTATVVAPTYEVTRGNDPNDRSIVLLLEIGEHLLLLMGDADGPAEPLGVDTDVLQVAHHGSRNAARAGFLADATPDIALVSTGRNSYGHPNEETLQRLEEAGADIYITRDTGALTLYFEPNTIRVEAYIK